MPIGPSDFQDLLKEYFIVKNAPDDGNKKDELDDIKMEIYDSYLNEDFERDPDPGALVHESKVMKEFFKEVEKHEKIYMKHNGVTIREMHAYTIYYRECIKEFIKNFKRKVLLKPDFRETLTTFQSRTSSSSSRSSTPRRRLSFSSRTSSSSSSGAGSRKSKKEKEIKIYKKLLKKKRLTKKEDSQLKRLMKRKYCSCLTKVKRSKKVKKGIEYPICLSSIYTKRNKKTPKNPRKICK